jgi:Domain of unknown function (DUF4351)
LTANPTTTATIKPTSKKRKPRSEQDSVWKEIITDYFREFMEFFYPKTAARIDWSKKYDFLDSELQKLTRGSERKKRLADKLVKVQLVDGKEKVLLVHIEVQSYADTDFAERMVIYYYRIFEKYKQRVMSVALITERSAENISNVYEVHEDDFHFRFEFPLVKISSYADQLETLATGNNPFAFVVLTHLRKMEAKNIQEKYDAKLELGKMLYDKGYKEQDVIKLYRFLDWLIRLSEKREKQFNSNLQQYGEKRRQAMAYVTSAERIGIKKGRQEGLAEGRQEGLAEGRELGREEALQEAQRQLREKLAEIVQRLAERKFGELEPELADSLKNLSVERLDELTLAVLDFAEQKDLRAWLKANQPNESQT